MAQTKNVTKLIYIFSFLVIAAITVFLLEDYAKNIASLKQGSEKSKEVMLENIQANVLTQTAEVDESEKLVELEKPDIYVSSYNVMQADALLVIARNELNEISGKLGALKLYFFRSQDNKDWIAIVGMHVKKSPGNYLLSINVTGKTDFKKTITVSKRKFTETKLVITPDLSKKGYTDQSIVSNIVNKENKELNEVFNSFTKNVYSPSPFIYPLSEIKVTGEFGDIRKSGDYAIQHLGVDLKAPEGTPVHAIGDGKVVFKESLIDYGNALILDHGLGVYSVYLHLSEFKVEMGQMVKQGDIIVLAGSTGYAIGPHLHFSIKVRGATLDPLKFIQTTQKWIP